MYTNKKTKQNFVWLADVVQGSHHAVRSSSYRVLDRIYLNISLVIWQNWYSDIISLSCLCLNISFLFVCIHVHKCIL